MNFLILLQYSNYYPCILQTFLYLYILFHMWVFYGLVLFRQLSVLVLAALLELLFYVSVCFYCFISKWMIDWLTDWMIDWLIDWIVPLFRCDTGVPDWACIFHDRSNDCFIRLAGRCYSSDICCRSRLFMIQWRHCGWNSGRCGCGSGRLDGRGGGGAMGRIWGGYNPPHQERGSEEPPRKINGIFHLKWRVLVRSERYFLSVSLPENMSIFRLKWWFGERWRCTFARERVIALVSCLLHCNASNPVLEICKHDKIPGGTICISVPTPNSGGLVHQWFTPMLAASGDGSASNSAFMSAVSNFDHIRRHLQCTGRQ